MPIKRALKKLFDEFTAPALLAVRADRFIQQRNRNRRLIIMYHGVVQRKSEINGRSLSAKQFERQLLYFKKNFDMVPLSRMFELKDSNITPLQPTIALTFDDGLENNFLNVLPLLEKHKMPVSFFISTIAIENENYILPAELIEIIRAKTKEETVQLGKHRFVKKGKYGIFRESDHLHAYAYIMQLQPYERKKILDEFSSRYHLDKILKSLDKESWKLMSAGQIKKLSQSSFAEIGSHAHEHFSLANLNDHEVESELKTSKQLLEQCIGRPVDTIAYPNGSYDDRVKMISKKCGYKNLLAAGELKKGEEDILPRVGILDGTSLAYNLMSVNRAFNRFGF